MVNDLNNKIVKICIISQLYQIKLRAIKLLKA
jgi:hypothetical protein